MRARWGSWPRSTAGWLRLGDALGYGTAALALDPHDEDARRNLVAAGMTVLLVHVVFFTLTTPVLWLLAVVELLPVLGSAWPRALVGLGCVAVCGVIVGRWVWALPKGVRRYLWVTGRRLPARATALVWWLIVPAWPLFLGTALLPPGVALVTGVALELLFVAARAHRLPGQRHAR